MNKIIFTLCITCSFYFTYAVGCKSIMADVDVNNSYFLDVDDDGTNDYWFISALTPYINNYIIGLNGNEIEVNLPYGVEYVRANRLEAGNPIGTLYWNDTAYLIQNGQGDFAGGTDEFGWVGLKLYKGGNWHYCFAEVRSPYSEAIISIYRSGYNPVAGGALKADDCSTGIPMRNLIEAKAFVAGENLQVSLASQEALGGTIQLVNAAGQVALEEKVQAQENVIPLNEVKSGIYFVTIQNERQLLHRTKVYIP